MTRVYTMYNLPLALSLSSCTQRDIIFTTNTAISSQRYVSSDKFRISSHVPRTSKITLDPLDLSLYDSPSNVMFRIILLVLGVEFFQCLQFVDQLLVLTLQNLDTFFQTFQVFLLLDSAMSGSLPEW